MPLVPASAIVTPAWSAGRGVGAFNVIGIEHAEALILGAEAAGVPVILAISENCVRYHGGLEPIALATLALARGAAVPASVHLDHAESVALVEEAIELGIPSVMFDASRLPYAENVRATRAVADAAHARGVWVEAELGEVGGKDGIHAPGSRTDPGEAAEYVAATGVDALAVAVGTSHAMTTRDTALDLPLIRRLRDHVGVPLVLHGSSGVPDDQLARAVDAGMTKINIATHLNKVFTGTVREVLAAQPGLVDSRRYLGPARDAMAGETARLLRLLHGA